MQAYVTIATAILLSTLPLLGSSEPGNNSLQGNWRPLPVGLQQQQQIHPPSSGPSLSLDEVVMVVPPPLQAILPDNPVKAGAPTTRLTPFQVIQLAERDAVAVANLGQPSLNPHNVVYLSLHNMPRMRRPRIKALVDKILNELNTQYRSIILTAALPPEDPVLLRVNLADYGIRKSAWVNLLQKGSGPVPIPEPYFNEPVQPLVVEYEVQTVTEYEKKLIGYYNGDTNQPAYQEVPVERTKKVPKGSKPGEGKVSASATWLALEAEEKKRGAAVAKLINVTQNKYPIARADWFLTYAPWAPAYYELIGLDLKDNPNPATKAKFPKVFLEKDFEKLFDFDFDKAKHDVVAAVSDTKMVTLHNRILLRFNTLRGRTGGSYWKSQDTDAGIKAEDYINQLANFLNPKKKAQEIIASGRNGLNFYSLTDDTGVILSVAAANIAQHSRLMPTLMQDQQVYAGRNCMFCHAGGQIYINDIVRTLAQGKIVLFVNDKFRDQRVARRLIDAFEPRLQEVIDFDNARFQAAVKAATAGLDPKLAGTAYEEVVQAYYDAPLNAERMAMEAGISTEELLAHLKQGIGIDYTLTAVLQTPPLPVYRLVWETQGYSAMMRYLLSRDPVLQSK